MTQDGSSELVPSVQQAAIGSQRAKTQWEQMLASRSMVLALLFCVTGCLGLPVLWISQAFSMTEKIVWSIVNTIYTLILIAIVGWICYWCYQQLQAAGVL